MPTLQLIVPPASCGRLRQAACFAQLYVEAGLSLARHLPHLILHVSQSGLDALQCHNKQWPLRTGLCLQADFTIQVAAMAGQAAKIREQGKIKQFLQIVWAAHDAKEALRNTSRAITKVISPLFHQRHWQAAGLHECATLAGIVSHPSFTAARPAALPGFRAPEAG